MVAHPSMRLFGTQCLMITLPHSPRSEISTAALILHIQHPICQSPSVNSILPRQTNYYWIGIRKVDDVWTWVGTNKTLTKEAENWADGEPNNGGNNEDCVEMYIKREADTGKWNDESCMKKKTALCFTASCQSDSCYHGECVETINSHHCKCSEGFYGEQCEHVVECKMEVTVPAKASVSCSHPNGNFSFDSTCQYFCEEGYRLSSSGPVRCTASESWSEQPPTCELVLCSEPGMYEPGKGSMACSHPLGSFSYLSTCTFTCEEGYERLASSSATLQCGASGQWNDSQPQCIAVSCPTLQQPQDGAISCGEDFTYGSSCNFSCSGGYLLKGAITVTCTSAADWTVQCPSPVVPLGGQVSCEAPSHPWGSVCNFSCDEGYDHQGAPNMQCSRSGEWSAETPTCTATPEPPLNPTILGLAAGGAVSLSGLSLAAWLLKRIRQKANKIDLNSTSDIEEPLQTYRNTSHFNLTMDFCSASQQTRSPSSWITLILLYSIVTMCTRVEGWSYHHSNKTMNWDTARKWCTEHYTDMVAIQNRGEISHLNSILPRQTNYYWIGIRKVDDVWIWVGTNKTLTKEAENWADGEPNNMGNNEDCVEMYIKREADTGKWNDESCMKKKTALCFTASCQSDSCYHGECVETINSHRCKCSEGFYGEQCEHVVECKMEVTVPAKASVSCSHPNGNFSFDSTCQYFCEEGYRLSSSGPVRCTASESWSEQPPTCELVLCSELYEPGKGSMACSHPLGSFSYLSTCTFTCEEGYERLASSSATLQCGASGQWNDSQSQCIAVSCPTLQQPQDGAISCGEDFTYGSSCNFSCSEGYLLKGAITVTCTSAAEWSEEIPHCEVVLCSELYEPGKGSMACSHPLGSFSYLSTCTFTCEEGYERLASSSATLQCGASGQWNDSQPQCIAVSCPTLQQPQDGAISCGEDFTYGSSCNFSCSEGYLLQGAITVTCTSAAEWSEEIPHCEVVLCSELYEPGKGSMACSHPLGSFSYLSTCTFTCEEGYERLASSSATLQCGASGQWNDSQLQCIAVSCPTLQQPQDGAISCGEDFTYGSSCNFSCSEGYLLKGAITVTCTSAAEWSEEIPHCEVVLCSELYEPGKGSMACSHPLGSFSYLSTCTFTCEEGYERLASSSATLQCGASGQWNDSQLQCIAVSCPTLQQPQDGAISCGEDFNYGSSCNFSCSEGYLLKGAITVTCTSAAEWSEEIPHCEAVQCPSPVVPLGGQVSCEAPSHPWGSVCNFSCDEGYDHQGAPNMQCSRSGEWSAETPTCTATPEPPLNPTILGLAAGGAVSLFVLSLAAWLLKRIRQKARSEQQLPLRNLYRPTGTASTASYRVQQQQQEQQLPVFL
ncbi:P-selectin-like [Oncorhynchus tshawytscha]|uniref:P-selectin-like n=1 Tax=Oncorhynchus tshawytscha TaxID=74940 RepID=UPI001C3E6586|nr:P-selectin-like [Oncorhynchus tshawytscha]